MVFQRLIQEIKAMQASEADLAWIRNIDAIAVEIRKFIPIVEVSLIIEDYIATPQPSSIGPNSCHRCNAWHRRTLSGLCLSCAKVCVFCNQLACGSEKTLVCNSCSTPQRRELVKWIAKDKAYVSWRLVRFPSEIHHAYLDRIKRDAADPVKIAAAAEKKRLEDEFRARENAKSISQQYIDARTALWEANEMINKQLRDPRGSHLKPRPVFPFH